VIELPATMQNRGNGNTRGSMGGEVCQGKQGQLKGRKVVNQFNASQELENLREWLSQLRGEVDAGLERVEMAINLLENEGPGQVKKKAIWMPKPKRKFWRKKKKNGVGSGLGPSAVKDGVGASVDLGLLKGPNPKPMAPMLSGGGQKVDLGPSEGPAHDPVGFTRADDGKAGEMGLKKGANRPGSDSSYASDKNDAGNDESGSLVEETQQEGEGRRSHLEYKQRTPIGCSASSASLCGAPTRGIGGFRDDIDTQNRPVCSWVAGRTGFGPVCADKTTGKIDQVESSEIGVVTTVPAVPEQAIGDRVEEITMAEAGETAQVVNLREPIIVTEVYRRRDDMALGLSKGSESGSGVKLVGGMEETVLEDVGIDAGAGLVSEETEDPYVNNTMKLSLEVSSVAGLSCDGQEERKEECLRRIVIEKHEKGKGGGSVSSDFQQEEDSQGSDWGNCSDYEA
jgi:hypothetical protein